MIPTKQPTTYDDIDLENPPSESSSETQICRYQVNDWEPRPITTEDRTEYNIVCMSCIFLSCMIVLAFVIIILVCIHLSNDGGNDF